MTAENTFPSKDTGNENLEVKFKKAIKKMVIVYSIIALICMFLFQAKLIVTVICLIQIGFTMYLYNKSKGIITIDYNSKFIQPSLFFPLLIPIVVLFATVIIEITIIDYTFFWIPFSIFLLVFILVIIKLIVNNEGKKKIGSFITSVILGAAFSFGFTINTNEVFSLQANEQYKAIIVDKWVIENRNTTYHFMLLPWGPIKDSSSIKILQYQYDKYQLGDSVTIEFNSGLYNIPFIKLVDK